MNSGCSSNKTSPLICEKYTIKKQCPAKKAHGNVPGFVDILINHRDIAALAIVEEKSIIPISVRTIQIPGFKDANMQQEFLANRQWVSANDGVGAFTLMLIIDILLKNKKIIFLNQSVPLNA